MRDKKIKKKLQEKLIQPSMTFDEWAAKYGVSLPDPQSSPEKQKSGNAAKGGEAAAVARRGNTVVLIAFALFFTAAIVCLVGKSIFGWNIYPQYGVYDVDTVRAELSDLENLSSVYLFDESENCSIGTVTKDVLKTDNSKTLSYVISNNAITISDGTKDEKFYFTYRVRLYKNYEFIYYSSYTNLESKMQINSCKVKYNVYSQRTPVSACASFSVGKYDYYIEANGQDETTVINESSFITLLETILK